MAIHRKRRPLVRTVETKDAKLIVIATEGEKTEKIYFDGFRNSRIKIRTIPSEEGRSAPSYVLENVQKFKNEYDLDADDELWLAGDVDRWPERNLSEIARSCASKRFRLAVSNPCFEIWLALHCPDDLEGDLSPDSLRKHLVSYLGAFSKSNFDVPRLLSGLSRAVKRAKVLDAEETGRWPQKSGTHVYKIFDRPDLLKSVRV